jgi:hypothetical protein
MTVQSPIFRAWFGLGLASCSAIVTPPALAGFCPPIAPQPADTLACQGQTVTFSVGDGGPTASYRWQYSLDNGLWNDWEDFIISNGVVIATLSDGNTRVLRATPDPLVYYTGSIVRVRCVVTTGCGPEVSDPADLFVMTPATIVTQPQSASVCPTGSSIFEVEASGVGPFTYQWQLAYPSAPGGWLDIVDGPIFVEGANKGTFSGATTLRGRWDGEYSDGRQPGYWSTSGFTRCIVSNSCGSTISEAATLTASQCDCLDFNNDAVFPDNQDLIDFLSVFAGAPCPTDPPLGPGCNDLDYNNDGIFPDNQDVADFVTAFAGGSC